MTLTFGSGTSAKVLTGDYIMSSVYTKNAVDTASSQEFAFGTAAGAGFTANIYTAEEPWKSFSFDGKEFILADDTGKQIGIMTVDKCKITNGVAVLTCTDCMKKFNKAYGGGGFPKTLWELWLQACDACGVKNGAAKTDFFNADIKCTSAEKIKGKTYRNVIQACAEADGGYAEINASGAAVIKHFTFGTEERTFGADEITGLTHEGVETVRQGVAIVNDGTATTFGSTEKAYLIQDNLILSSASKEDIKRAGNSILAAVKNTDFTAGSFNCLYDGTVDTGDCVKATDRYGKVYKMTVAEITITNSRSLAVKAVGDAKGEASTATYQAYRDSASDSAEEYSFNTDYARNNLRITAKGGEFSVASKDLSGITKFTKCVGVLTVKFTYPAGKRARFNIYCGTVLLHTFLCAPCAEGENTVSFTAPLDTPDGTECTYIASVVCGNDEEFVAEPFSCTLDLIVRSGNLEDTVADNPYIVDAVTPVNLRSLIGEPFVFGSISDGGGGEDTYWEWDASAKQDKSVMASFSTYDGILKITGKGAMRDYTSGYGSTPEPWFGNSVTLSDGTKTTVSALIKKITVGEGITHIGSYSFTGFMKKCTQCKEVDIKCNTAFTVGQYALQGGYEWSQETSKTVITVIDHPELITAAAAYSFVGANIKADKGFPLSALTSANTGDKAFGENQSIKGMLSIPLFTSVPARCFTGNIGMTSVLFGRTFTGNVGDFGFNNCNGVTHLYTDRTPEGGPALGTAFCEAAFTATAFNISQGTAGTDAQAKICFGDIKQIVLPATVKTFSYAYSGCTRYTAYKASIDA